MTDVIGDFFFILACYSLSDTSEREEKAPSKWFLDFDVNSYIILKLESILKHLILTCTNSPWNQVLTSFTIAVHLIRGVSESPQSSYLWWGWASLRLGPCCVEEVWI